MLMIYAAMEYCCHVLILGVVSVLHAVFLLLWFGLRRFEGFLGGRSVGSLREQRAHCGPVVIGKRWIEWEKVASGYASARFLS